MTLFDSDIKIVEPRMTRDSLLSDTAVIEGMAKAIIKTDKMARVPNNELLLNKSMRLPNNIRVAKIQFIKRVFLKSIIID